jgi:hypothetical protein
LADAKIKARLADFGGIFPGLPPTFENSLPTRSRSGVKRSEQPTSRRSDRRDLGQNIP